MKHCAILFLVLTVVLVGCCPKPQLIKESAQHEIVTLKDLLANVNHEIAAAREAVSDKSNSGTLIQSIELELAITKANTQGQTGSFAIGVPLPVAEIGASSSFTASDSLQALNRIKLVLTNPLFTQFPGEKIDRLCDIFSTWGLTTCKPVAAPGVAPNN